MQGILELNIVSGSGVGHETSDFETNAAILWNTITLTSFVFTELANTMKYGGGFLLTLFSPSDINALHRMKYGGGGVI